MHFPTTSKTLINSLHDGNDVSWQSFFDRYAGPIRELGALKGLTPDECDDLVQEVMLRFVKRSHTFRFDPAIARFRTFFSGMIRGLIIDIKRRREQFTATDNKSTADMADEDHALPDELLDEALLLKWQEFIKDNILSQLRKTVSPLNYSIFELHVLQNCSSRETARLLNVSLPKVYLVKSRCIKHLQKFCRQAMQYAPDMELNADEF